MLCLMLCVFLALCARLGFIQLKNGNAYETMAVKQQKRERAVMPIRGAICDRHGLAFTDEETEILTLTDTGEIKKGSGGVFDFKKTIRTPRIAKHLIGYTSADGGVCGIEGLYDDFLKTDRETSIEYISDAVGRPIDEYVIKNAEGGALSSVRLTLDYDIQSAAEEVMDEFIPKGAAVVLDVSSFDVLAVVSRPNFDGESIEKSLKSDDGELLNRALLSYNAGSVFKIITTAAALESDPSAEARSFDCRGSFDLGDGHIFGCHKSDGHGVIGLGDAFINSCNCAYYLLGIESGGEALVSMASRFGMGKRLLNLELWENGGNLPKRSEYSRAEPVNLAIGQGEILITPLQCAVMAGVVASGGVMHEVNIAEELRFADGSCVQLKKIGAERVISEETASKISEMMRGCVLYGTAKAAADSEALIAGKTGSAESGWVEDGESLVHGWFCGFFPADKPRYAMAILAEGAGSGAQSCVEPFARLAEKIANIL